MPATVVNLLIKKYWVLRLPLAPDAGGAVLAFWIEKSKSDEWTFDDLGRALGAIIDDGLTPPPALALWACEVAAKRRARPTRTGPKSDPKKDAILATFTALLQAKDATSERAAVRKVGGLPGMSAEGVRSAGRRAWRV